MIALIPVTGTAALTLARVLDAVAAVPGISDTIVIAEDAYAVVRVDPGASRFARLRAGLAAAGPGPVLICDAAHPLATPARLRALLAALDDAPAAATVAPVKATIKVVENGVIAGGLPRDQLFQVAGPRAFRRQTLEDVLAGPEDADEIIAAGLAGVHVALQPDEEAASIAHSRECAIPGAFRSHIPGNGRIVGGADVAVVVLAAGSGRRMGAGVNKVLLGLGGRSILSRSLEIFESHPAVATIVLVGDRSELEGAAAGVEKLAAIVPGGPTRHRSEYLGLRAVASGTVLVHDAARPFVTAGEVDRVIAAARSTGAAILATPVRAPTLVQVDREGRWHRPPSTLWAALTPQAFETTLILEAHERAARDGFEATDTASVAAHAGHPVSPVEGTRANIKITTPADLALAEWLLPLWSRDPDAAARHITHL